MKIGRPKILSLEKRKENAAKSRANYRARMWACPECGKQMKNSSRCYHIKTCGRDPKKDKLNRLEEIYNEFQNDDFTNGAEFTNIVSWLHKKHFITNQQRYDLIDLLQTI